MAGGLETPELVLLCRWKLCCERGRVSVDPVYTVPVSRERADTTPGPLGRRRPEDP